MREARANAHIVQKRGLQASSAAAKFLNDDDMRHNRLAMMVPWQEQVLSDTEEVCGLVCFYPDRDDCAVFKEKIETAIYHGLHFRAERLKNETIAKFTLHWVKIDDTPDRDLRGLFTEKRDKGEFPKGLRTDSFLFVDREALQSRDSKRPFVWLWEPKRTSAPDEEEDEKEEEEKELGPLKIDIKHIAPTLFARLIQRDFSTKEARRKPYRLGSKFKTLHRVTKYLQNPTTRERDWIWPPPARFM
jgi:hypothetical protein